MLKRIVRMRGDRDQDLISLNTRPCTRSLATYIQYHILSPISSPFALSRTALSSDIAPGTLYSILKTYTESQLVAQSQTAR